MIDIAPGAEVMEASLGVLHEVFGYDAFRGPQADIVGHVGAGGDVDHALTSAPRAGPRSASR